MKSLYVLLFTLLIAGCPINTVVGSWSDRPGTTGGVAGSTTAAGQTTSGSSTGSSGTTTRGGLLDGMPCTANDLCESGVCGLDGSGNCCTASCKTDDALCAASACDTKGACTYPAGTEGRACNSSCQYGLFTGSVCNNGACSAQPPVQCPMNLVCNTAGTACAGTCDPAKGTADCSLGWYCASIAGGGVCTPQISLGPCAANAECMSNVCGVTGTGHCCTQTDCTNTTAPCGTSDCDNETGECTFGSPTTSCDTGPITCLADHQTQVDPNTSCDGMGDCVPPIMTNCSPYACEAGNGDGGCRSDCSTLADCAKDFYCLGGACVPQSAVGPCTENDACISLQCGASGTGNCCLNPCGATDPSCGITNCNANNGACLYPGDASAPCGSVLESCSGVTQQNPGICDGMGNCPAPGTTDCAPFACGATACNTTCTESAECAPGDVCDTSAKLCCPTLQNGGTLNVDAQNGSDSAACCGAVGYTECQTIGRAMSIIDSAQAQNVTINAYIGGQGNGGDWTFGGSGDSIPITLGWGVELVAPNVNFAPNWFDLSYNGFSFQAYPEIFDIAQYASNDTLGYASIVGSVADGPVQIGASASNGVYTSINNAAIQIENGARLYIANANVFSNWYNYFYLQYDGYYSSYSPQEGAAFVVAPGGHLTLGQDQTAANTGTVTVGVIGTASSPQQQSWGWTGIACQSDYTSLGCTIDDATLPAGMSSLVMASMVKQDIDAEDFATITLSSAPSFGVTPSSTGFRNCPYKGEGYEVPGTPAILLNGFVTMTLTNPIVQCVEGDAIHMNTSSHGNGNPTLTLTGATLQNTERAFYASAGTATISGSTFWYNYNNVKIDTDGTNSASVNLNGGVKDGNTIVCTSAEESYGYSGGETPSTNVLNTTSNVVDASNVTWDTPTPDEFMCDSSLTSCTCEVAACANAGGVDDMDAVYTNGGTITTTGNLLTTADCTPPKLCSGQVCSAGTVCCNFIYEYCSDYYMCEDASYCDQGFYEGYDYCPN